MGCDVVSHHVTSCHPSAYKKQTNSIPAGQHDLKTVKSVCLSLRPANLSKLQCCWTTAEERMARPQTAAEGGELITEIFRERVHFKGAWVWVLSLVLCSCLTNGTETLLIVFHWFLPPLPPLLFSLQFFSHAFLLPPILITLFLVMSSQGWCRAGVAFSSEQLVWRSGNIAELAAVDKHRSVRCLPARVLQGLAGPGRVEGGPEGPWQTVPLGEQLLPHCHPLSGNGTEVTLPVGRGSDSMSKRRVCACLVSFVCSCPCS